MILVVDTSVWSRVLRRRAVHQADPYVVAFRGHIERGNRLYLAGPVLQELLSGLKNPADFDRLLAALAVVPMVELRRDSFVLAAQIADGCRRHGVQAGAIDFLIAAACVQNGYPLLTADRHFLAISRWSPLVVLPPLA